MKERWRIIKINDQFHFLYETRKIFHFLSQLIFSIIFLWMKAAKALSSECYDVWCYYEKIENQNDGTEEWKILIAWSYATKKAQIAMRRMKWKVLQHRSETDDKWYNNIKKNWNSAKVKVHHNDEESNIWGQGQAHV